MACFQAYTNTYGELATLRELYEEALRQTDVVGIIIATRPDCMPQELLEYLSELSKTHFVMVEYGVETSHDATLKLINRGHTWHDVEDAVTRTAAAGVLCGAHLILGLPGEDMAHFVTTAKRSSALPLHTVKMHQLQVIKGTRLAQMYAAGEVTLKQWTADEYIDVCIEMLKHLRSDLAVERFVSQSPDGLLICPRWGLKNYEFTNRLNNKIKARRVSQVSDA